MEHQPTTRHEEEHQRALDYDFPLLLAKRYSPETKDGQDSAREESIASTPRSHFSFSRLARGVVDSLMPEPLRPQRVLKKRPPPLDLSPSKKFNASTVALSEMSKHQVRPCSSVYDPNRPWPASTVCSEAVPLHEVEDSSRLESHWTGGHNGRTWTSEPPTQLAPMSAGSKGKGKAVTGDRTRHSPQLDTELRFWLSSGSLAGGPPFEDVDDQTTTAATNTTALSEAELEQQAAEREDQLVSQVAALHLPTFSRRKQTLVVPSASSSFGDTEPLLQSHDDYVPFDPVDPYHRSGQPKKKTLYGPEGYLGKKKDWKQSHLQKMVSKVGSVGTRVKNSIRRSLEGSAKDQRNELVFGIVMKPNLPIHVARKTQAEIYSKLELFMCVAANEYLLVQLHYNRFVGTDSLKRFVDFWKAKNRPVVPEFQFDLKTQYEIVIHNVRNFEFPGKYGLDPVLLKSTLDAWGSVVSQLQVRNFCWPDSAILKLFHDVYPVLEMLGAPIEFMGVFLEMRRLVVQIIEESKKIKKVDKASFDPHTDAPTMPRRGYHSG
ncbi:hypothetical protein PISL3812_01148 [Talaromyces islandicus]|uniref:Uncharacterized protein n=1 Tax=Talaromyces islandicus TaxID=28573 RepID=A0A0U1LLV2_TALIS|nr:hypothetical protein PISL3812_01148 [Talaromyces islandicus]